MENCIFSGNAKYGISIGYRDTDNLIQGCTIERNGEVGILFRNEGAESRGGHRNRIDGCLVRDTGTERPGIGIDIQGKTRDITIQNTKLENSTSGKQSTGIRIGRETQGIVLKDNTFDGCRTTVGNLQLSMLNP